MKQDNSQDPNFLQKIALLETKFAAMGQDMHAYLEGLLHSDYLTYWDYIHLDILLNIQKPKTAIPDEEIFIIYHQITELYFKLLIKALKTIQTQISDRNAVLEQFRRCHAYMDQLIQSFHIMRDGMDKEQFLKFRMALLPASGFQSMQYRSIELLCSEAWNLSNTPISNSATNSELYDSLYWKRGGLELSSGKSTLTLKQFETKYHSELMILIEDSKVSSLHALLNKHYTISVDEQLRTAMRLLDLQLEVLWPLSHYRSAVRYLELDPIDIAATGGTNWQEYLPPKFQRISLFPSVWSNEELKAWGTQIQQQHGRTI